MQKNTIIVITLSILSLLLWNTIVLYPLKLLVVLMHETGHALAALVTGGDVIRIEVNAMQGGMTYTLGGNRFIILTSGYLGSCIIGACVIWSSSNNRMCKYVAEIFGFLIILEAVLWIRDLFTFSFAILMGCFCIFIGLKIRGAWEKIMMQLIGIVCCLYAIYDIFTDIIFKYFSKDAIYAGKSDAEALAEITFIPSIVWGIIWIIVALAFLLFTLKKLPKTVQEPEKNKNLPRFVAKTKETHGGLSS